MQINTLAIIPWPAQLERKAGEFVLSPRTVITTDAANQQNAAYLCGLLAPPTGLPLPVHLDGSVPANVIRLTTGQSSGREGYTLSVSPQAIIIKAAEPAGVFYGIQTLRQLLPAQIEQRTRVAGVPWQAPCVEMADAPRFSWRSHMLDEGRHFHGKETVKRTLDLMALHKLNAFHWHLTEDQGWRIEIKQYPRLTEIGSKRQGTTPGLVGKHNGIPHEGFYTQADIREVVAYAAERHITIVPEIEMPGHSRAALAAYPELSCTGGQFEVACGFGVFQDIYCAGKENTFAFLQAVLDEVTALFPSPFVHIGGDEAPKSRWKTCPDCQSRIRQEGLKDEHALQVYLTNRIGKHLEAHGRRLVGWNQILQPGLSPGAVAQYWIGNRKPAMEAVRHGRDVIVSPFLKTYLDRSYSVTPLSTAYAFEPVFSELGGDAHVLGLEAPLWCEFVPTRARLDYQVWPRLAAYAETGWTPKGQKDLTRFRACLRSLLLRLDELGVKYAPMSNVEPNRLAQWLGVFTLLQPQTRVAP